MSPTIVLDSEISARGTLTVVRVECQLPLDDAQSCQLIERLRRWAAPARFYHLSSASRSSPAGSQHFIHNYIFLGYSNMRDVVVSALQRCVAEQRTCAARVVTAEDDEEEGYVESESVYEELAAASSHVDID